MLSFFSSRRNWDSPNPLPAGECAPPPPPGSGGRGTLAGERGVGRVPIPTRRHTLWYSLYIHIYVLCGFTVLPPEYLGCRIYIFYIFVQRGISRCVKGIFQPFEPGRGVTRLIRSTVHVQ